MTSDHSSLATAAARAGRLARVRGVLAPAAPTRHFAHESAERPPHAGADEVLQRVRTTLAAMPADEVPDGAAFERAATLLLRHGEPALRRVLDLPEPPPAAGFDADALIALEAIVIADGSRPSFLLRDGRVAADHPFLSPWRTELNAAAEPLRRVAAAVGRIEPANGHAAFYIGTGTLVDRDRGLVLTNRHVVHAARNAFGIVMRGDEHRLQVRGRLLIDFDAEAGAAAKNLFRVVEVQLPRGAANGFGGLDAAVLRIEAEASSSRLPEHGVGLSADPAFAAGSAGRSLCVVGFPAEPREEDMLHGAEVDWNFVLRTLFGNRFGCKRLAPGHFRGAPGSDPRDQHAIALAHDATTFGGASGSLLLAWREAALPAFGLHFAGTTGRLNHAISFARALDALREVGLQFG